MSMLGRFRKQGGFFQLLTLIETCDPIKQKNLLHLVSVEDPGWAYLVRTKCLTLEKVFNWPTEVLLEITPHLTEKVLISLYASLDDIKKQKLMNALSSSQIRLVKELMSSHSSTSAEQNAAAIKLIQTVRELEAEGKIKFSNFDPSLAIDPSLAA
jgi:flagellar motor switch protein FliG